MSNALTITKGLAVLAALSLFGCLGGGAVVDYSQEPTQEQDKTEPRTWSDEQQGSTNDTPRTADEREQIANANGAAASFISFNHPEPHALVISALDLSAAHAGVYQLSQGGGAYGELHTHDVTLTADQMSAIRDGAELTIDTSAGGGSGGAHTHTVTIAKR